MRSPPAVPGRLCSAPTGQTYAEKIGKAEALIDWREDAAQILRRVRAFNPSPVAETRLQGTQLRIWEAQIAPDEPGAAPAGLEPGTVTRATAARHRRRLRAGPAAHRAPAARGPQAHDRPAISSRRSDLAGARFGSP